MKRGGCHYEEIYLYNHGHRANPVSNRLQQRDREYGSSCGRGNYTSSPWYKVAQTEIQMQGKVSRVIAPETQKSGQPFQRFSR